MKNKKSFGSVAIFVLSFLLAICNILPVFAYGEEAASDNVDAGQVTEKATQTDEVTGDELDDAADGIEGGANENYLPGRDGDDTADDSGSRDSSNESSDDNSNDGDVAVKNELRASGGKTYCYYGDQKQYGFQEVDGRNYFFNKQSGAMYKGQLRDGGHWYFFDSETGEMAKAKFVTLTKAETNDGPKTVYYDENGWMLYGHQAIEEKNYFFNKQSGAMYKGQLRDGGHWYFFDSETGEMAKAKFVTLTKAETNDGPKTVYYDENGWMLYGVQEIDSVKYCFSFGSGAKVVGQFYTGGHWYYYDEEESDLAKSRFVALTSAETNDGPKTVYYDANGWMVHGVYKIDGKYYYFHNWSGRWEQNDVVFGNVKYLIKNGELYGTILLNVPYYSQNDSRWANRKYGLSTIGKTGCSVAVGASLINYFAGTSMMPYDTAWLFNKWGDYNANGVYGTTSRVWRKVGSAFGINFRNSLSLGSMTDHLRIGHMIKASVQGLPFMKGGGSHALLLMGLNENGQTYVYDPANSRNNGWYSVEQIWNQRSTSYEDLYDGGPFFAMWR